MEAGRDTGKQRRGRMGGKKYVGGMNGDGMWRPGESCLRARLIFAESSCEEVERKESLTDSRAREYSPRGHAGLRKAQWEDC